MTDNNNNNKYVLNILIASDEKDCVNDYDEDDDGDGDGDADDKNQWMVVVPRLFIKVLALISASKTITG